MDYQTILKNIEQQGFASIIAFSGGSSEELEVRVNELIEQAMQEISGKNIAILTGGTKWGVPKYATQKAKEKSLPVIGVYPSRGAKYALNNLDYALEIPPRFGESEWGDETEIFTKLAKGVIIIGGGFGTAIEFTHVMKSNEGRIKNKLSPVYVAPVSLMAGDNSFADRAYDFKLSPEMQVCMPAERLTEGREAMNFLLNKLGLK